MTLFLISFVAGVLTVLAPCVLPLLPVVIGTSVGARRKATPFIVIGSLATSILLFTYLLKASTALITIPPAVWSYIGGGIMVGFGITMVFPYIWNQLPGLSNTSKHANQLVGTGYKKQSVWGDILIGAALGPVFSTCSPTYFVILATVLPASFFLGTLYLLGYIAGLVLMLGLIALLGQRITTRLTSVSDAHGIFKKSIGIVFIMLGIAIISGYDKQFETWLITNTAFDITRVEQSLLDTIAPTSDTQSSKKLEPEASSYIPSVLKRHFPDTDWSRVDPRIESALSGGPTKDGIPALDTPVFEPLTAFTRSGDIQAIVIAGETETKVYPYHILTMNEIVNDSIDNVPIAVTFCPLCGSAIVYNRTLPDGTVSTFGVSGSLLESNMIMYDRATENLWQQSTGATLAGSWHPHTLTLEPFQLMTIHEIRAQFPAAVVLSERTGYQRDYGRNPYSGYTEEQTGFYFVPSVVDTTLPPKTIVAVWRHADTAIAVPWLALRSAKTTNYAIDDSHYTLTVSPAGSLKITDQDGMLYPFYFEMWFSYAVQHPDNHLLVRL